MTEEAAEVMPEFDKKIKLLSIVQNYQMAEVDLVWRRSTLFITLNAVAIAAVFSQPIELTFKYIICFLGLLLTVAWLQVHRKGVWYAERFFLDAKNIIVSDPEIASAFQCSIDQVRTQNRGIDKQFIDNFYEHQRREPKGLSATRTFKLVVWLFIALWIAMPAVLFLSAN